MNFYVFAYGKGDHRLDRLKEECGKRDDVKIIPIDMREVVICGEGLYVSSLGKLDFENSVVWMLSNLSPVQNISDVLNRKGILTWPSSSALMFADKFDTSLFFSSVEVSTPKTVFINNRKNIDNIVNFLGGYPCVIKKTVGSMGMFVEIVNNREEVIKFIENTFQRALNSKMTFNRIKFILQELVDCDKGVDYRVLCIDGEIVGAIKRTAQSGFKSNISLGGVAEQIEVDDKLREYTKKIIKNGNIFYAGIDFIKVKDDYLAIEVNTSAQFQGFEKATGINVAGKIIEKLIEKRLN